MKRPAMVVGPTKKDAEKACLRRNLPKTLAASASKSAKPVLRGFGPDDGYLLAVNVREWGENHRADLDVLVQSGVAIKRVDL